MPPNPNTGTFSPTSCRVSPVASRGDLKTFARLERRLRAGRGAWVEPLKLTQRALLDRRRHAFYDGGRGAEAELFLARDGRGGPVGRIAAIINHRYDAHVGDAEAGFFGFFDCIDSAEVAAALIAAAGEWLAARGRKHMLGPASPSEAYDYGLLVEGFDQPHRFMLAYQPRYYADLLEAAGLRKAKDLLALSADLGGERMRAMVDRFLELAGRAEGHSGGEVTIRSPDIRDFAAEIRAVRGLFSEVLGRLWGHCPLGEQELADMAWSLRHFYIPEAFLIAEQAGRPVGLTLAVPDLNETIRKLKLRTRLLEPIELYLRTRRWRPQCARILALGVTRACERTPVVPAMVGWLARNVIARGIRYVDAHLVLEDNASILVPLRRYGFRIDRRYRIYRAEL